MEDRKTKFRKFIEHLPRLCSPTICGTLSQPTTRAERSGDKKRQKFEWSLEQKAILSPANITTATCSDPGELDESFLHHESEQFFSQRTIAPSPMTTPRLPIFRECNEEEDIEEEDDEYEEDEELEEDEDDDEEGENAEIDDDDEDDDDRTEELEVDTEEDDYNDNRDQDQDMDSLFLSPPLKSSQTQQRVDIFSPETFTRVMDDENTLQSTPKTIGSQISRTRTRRGSDITD